MAGSFDLTNLPKLPGLYANIVEAAANAIQSGERGVVALPLMTHSGTATAKQFYTVAADTLKDAEALFGAANIESIEFILRGGAREVLVYTMPSAPVESDYDDMRLAFDAKDFNLFVFDGEETALEQDNTLSWMQMNRTEGKHFMVVFGGSSADDADPSVGNARSVRLADEYAVNLITGVVINGEEYSSGEFAPYIAGLIAGTAINRAITYTPMQFVGDVNRRLRKSEQKTAIENGSLVLIHDGEKVKVLQGLTTDNSKIRTQRARQAILEDLERTATDRYIGKLNNNEAGQVTIMNAVMAYLTELGNQNVLVEPTVELDPNNASSGDALFLRIAFTEVDSVERIFVTINV